MYGHWTAIISSTAGMSGMGKAQSKNNQLLLLLLLK
jgi:hypothetical protein